MQNQEPGESSAPQPTPTWSQMESLSWGQMSSPRVRETLVEECEMCGKCGWWTGYGPDAVYMPPATHRIESIGDIVIDTCTRSLAL